MTVFLCEDSVCGILTGVYDAWGSKKGHANVKLALKEGYQPELFMDCQYVKNGCRESRQSAPYFESEDVPGRF